MINIIFKKITVIFTTPVPTKKSKGKIDNNITAMAWKKSLEK